MPSPIYALKNVVRDRVPERQRAGLYEAFYRLRGASSLLYSGSGRFCPCCDGSFRRFRDFEGEVDARCPRCGSLPRQRLLMLYLQAKTRIFTDELRVLHLAPEPGLATKLRHRPNLDHVTADLNLPLADVKLDITEMPFEDDDFDVILAVHILEHIPDDRKAMRELHRVLKPTGWAILQVPIDWSRETSLEDPAVDTPEERLRVYGQSDHVRIYGADYVERLRECGFEVTVDHFVRELSPKLVTQARLQADEDVVFVRPAAS